MRGPKARVQRRRSAKLSKRFRQPAILTKGDAKMIVSSHISRMGSEKALELGNCFRRSSALKIRETKLLAWGRIVRMELAHAFELPDRLRGLIQAHQDAGKVEPRSRIRGVDLDGSSEFRFRRDGIAAIVVGGPQPE